MMDNSMNIGIVNAEEGQENNPDQDHDPAKKLSLSFKLNFALGTGRHSLYAKEFAKDRIRYISRIQIGLAIAMVAVQIATMCTLSKLTSIEKSGVGIWGPGFVILAAICAQLTCKNMTYRRLCISSGMHAASKVAMVALIILATTESIPQQKLRLFYTDEIYYNYNYYNDNYGYNRTNEIKSLGIISLILTTVLTLAGFIQCILSYVVFWKSVSAICTRSYKMEFHRHLETEMKENSDQGNPPPYEELPGIGTGTGVETVTTSN